MKNGNFNGMLYLGLAAFLLIQFGCVAGDALNPNFVYKVPAIKSQLTAEEQKRIENKELPVTKVSTGYEERAFSLFERLHQKSPLLAKELGRIPEFQDGVSASEVKALENIVNLVKDINFPPDFAQKKNNGTFGLGQHIFISWGYGAKEKLDWSGHFQLGYQGNKGRTLVLLRANPYEFESEDKINYKTIHYSNVMDKRFISWKSTAGAGDIDGIKVILKAKNHNNLTLLLNGEFTTFTTAELSSKDLSLYDGQVKIELLKDTPYSRVNILEHMVLAGRGRKYSSLLQALLWGYMDGIFAKDDNPLENYNGPVDFVQSIWGDMQGPRWKGFNKVTDRLNDPRLLDYYEKFNFHWANGCSEVNITNGLFGCDASWLFYQKAANCGAYTQFTIYTLEKAGYKAGAIRVEGQYEYGFHYLTAYIDKGKIFIMDNGRGSPMGILGPFDSLEQIPHPRTNRIYFGMP